MLKLMWFVNGKYLNQHWARRNVTSASTNVKRIGALNSIHIVYNILFESKPTLSEYSLYLLKGSSTLFVKWATRQRFQSHSESPASFNYFDPLMNFLKRFVTNKILWLKRITSTVKWHTFFACLPQAENFLAARFGIISIDWFWVTFLPLSRANLVSLPNYAPDPLRSV